uniref:IS66 family transposase n=1 Tax=Bacillus bingmayongensis TaxID=1150157 RepID=UPI001ED98A42|nr:transposase [Bacillus bingmayongensis]
MYLQRNGYSGNHQVPDITLVGCCTHARRKFDEALKTLPSRCRLPKKMKQTNSNSKIYEKSC